MRIILLLTAVVIAKPTSWGTSTPIDDGLGAPATSSAPNANQPPTVNLADPNAPLSADERERTMQLSIRRMRTVLSNPDSKTTKSIIRLQESIERLTDILIETPSTPVVPRPGAAVGPMVTFSVNGPPAQEHNGPHMLAGY
jgi:hypothetical protein